MKPLAQDAALRVAPVCEEAVADDRLACAPTSVSTATRPDGHWSMKEMKALRISDAIGAVASRMRVILHGRSGYRRHAHAFRHTRGAGGTRSMCPGRS